VRFTVSLQTRSPLAISLSRATGNQLRTARHVPGAVWRGAVAAAMVRDRRLGDRAHEDQEFALLFLQQKVRFGDLRPSAAKPWPLSARWCKQYQERHRMVDLLLSDASSPERPLECFDAASGQPCGAKLAQPEGFYIGSGKNPKATKPAARLTAHTAIENSSLRSRAAQFFTTEILESDQQFNGQLWAEPEAEELVSRMFEKEPFDLTVGRGTTRGQGAGVLSIAQSQGGQAVEEICASLRQFNEGCASTGEVLFSCTLRSPCIVYDRWLCARSWLTPEDIAEAAGSKLPGYELRTWFSRTVSLSGWHSAAQLPKPDTTAIAPGSAFLFRRTIDEADREREYEALAQVLAAISGIGERWEEGMGEAAFCDDFHIHQRYEL
jgi:CRISPR-associated protein Csx10